MVDRISTRLEYPSNIDVTTCRPDSLRFGGLDSEPLQLTGGVALHLFPVANGRLQATVEYFCTHRLTLLTITKAHDLWHSFQVVLPT